MIFSNYGLNFVQIIHGRQRLVSRNIYELFIPVQRAYFEILVGYQSEITGFISSSDSLEIVRRFWSISKSSLGQDYINGIEPSKHNIFRRFNVIGC